MKYYAVIDTNVLVSAMLKWDSIPGNVMELVFTGSIVPVVNEEILREYREVLARPKFHFTERIICDVIENMERQAVYINEISFEDYEELPDPKDKVFFAVVVEERKTEEAYLVTGNLKHFPRRTFIVTLREMLEIIMDSAA